MRRLDTLMLGVVRQWSFTWHVPGWRGRVSGVNCWMWGGLDEGSMHYRAVGPLLFSWWRSR